jgi:hypothetical protein
MTKTATPDVEPAPTGADEVVVTPVVVVTPKRPKGPSPLGTKVELESAAKSFAKFTRAFRDVRGGVITGDAYDAILRSYHGPALLVRYVGQNPSVSHRRTNLSRDLPSYVFGANGGAVVITDPVDIPAYLSKAAANPETWQVSWENGA